METRKTTKYLLDLVDGNCVNEKKLILDLLNFMSESDVKEFCEQYGWIEAFNE